MMCTASVSSCNDSTISSHQALRRPRRQPSITLEEEEINEAVAEDAEVEAEVKPAEEAAAEQPQPEQQVQVDFVVDMDNSANRHAEDKEDHQDDSSCSSDCATQVTSNTNPKNNNCQNSLGCSLSNFDHTYSSSSATHVTSNTYPRKHNSPPSGKLHSSCSSLGNASAMTDATPSRWSSGGENRSTTSTSKKGTSKRSSRKNGKQRKQHKREGSHKEDKPPTPIRHNISDLDLEGTAEKLENEETNEPVPVEDDQNEIPFEIRSNPAEITAHPDVHDDEEVSLNSHGQFHDGKDKSIEKRNSKTFTPETSASTTASQSSNASSSCSQNKNKNNSTPPTQDHKKTLLLTEDRVRSHMVDYYEDYDSIFRHGKTSKACWEAFFQQYFTDDILWVRSTGNPIGSDGLAQLLSEHIIGVSMTMVSIDSIQIMAGGLAACVVFTADQEYLYRGKPEADRTVITSVLHVVHGCDILIAHEHRCVGKPIPKETRWES